ncbi:TetR/AcrR family transcriptional regulator [Streptomyces sp. YIM 98790]|uniref:TetR/AcrR family transcriptional regulator n=1 Tax=Streptomyces sp. YIM 98790 TaxID=2689077 RepID=UPI0037DD799E
MTALPSSTKLGLRERKKLRTRQAIRHAAYRLFAERGYDGTRIDEIAEAAEVSPSTVFRYFPTKEDIVLTDEYDPMLVAALRARPAEEPPMTALRRAVRASMGELMAVPGVVEETRQRMRLVMGVPALRARMSEGIAATGDMLRGVLAERTGRARDDLELRVVVGAALGAMTEMLFHWSEHNAEDDLLDLLDRTWSALEDPFPG